MALGALIIQTKFQYADREFVEQITKNPYLQYFIVLPDYVGRNPNDNYRIICICFESVSDAETDSYFMHFCICSQIMADIWSEDLELLPNQQTLHINTGYV